MSVNVHPIPSDSDSLHQYVNFCIDHYKGNTCYVPPIVFDDVNTLSPDVNPAFEFCEAQCFMAFRNGEPVGAITGIINHASNEKTGTKTLRFGFVEFIDDQEVVDELFRAVEEWGRSKGMTEIAGPMGFTDMDHEGMLIEGFDEIGTMATIYNYPYYPTHMERLGFVKDVDWLEYRITVPDSVPERYSRIGELVKRKYNLRVLKFKRKKDLASQYGQAIFKLINEAYSDLYGYVPLTPRQIEHYIDQYLGILRLDSICLIVDAADELIAVGISMPSMSKALQKSQGRLWPFGWWHILKGLRGSSDVVDLMLVAVKPEYQSKGVNALLFTELIPAYIANGYKYAESNVELEGNEKVRNMFEFFERRQHRRRRAYHRAITPPTKHIV